MYISHTHTHRYTRWDDLLGPRLRERDEPTVMRVRTHMGGRGSKKDGHNRIVGHLYRVPGAAFTLIYSHGNATDIGAMRDRYIELSRRLQVKPAEAAATELGAE